MTRLLGRDAIELTKTFLLVVVTVIAVISLQQLAATRGSRSAGDADRSTVLRVSRDFGQALTTYDYAHLNVQERQLAPVAAPPVVDQVRGSFSDLRAYQAVSVGERPDAYVQNVAGDQAQVLLLTRSTMQSVHVPPGTHTSGLLLCMLRRQGDRWLVSDYRWLTPVTEGVS